jgi:hypothetical protein
MIPWSHKGERDYGLFLCGSIRELLEPQYE